MMISKICKSNHNAALTMSHDCHEKITKCNQNKLLQTQNDKHNEASNLLQVIAMTPANRKMQLQWTPPNCRKLLQRGPPVANATAMTCSHPPLQNSDDATATGCAILQVTAMTLVSRDDGNQSKKSSFEANLIINHLLIFAAKCKTKNIMSVLTRLTKNLV